MWRKSKGMNTFWRQYKWWWWWTCRKRAMMSLTEIKTGLLDFCFRHHLLLRVFPSDLFSLVHTQTFKRQIHVRFAGYFPFLEIRDYRCHGDLPIFFIPWQRHHIILQGCLWLAHCNLIHTYGGSGSKKHGAAASSCCSCRDWGWWWHFRESFTGTVLVSPTLVYIYTRWLTGGTVLKPPRLHLGTPPPL